MKDKRIPYIIAGVALVLIIVAGVVLIHLPLSKQLQEKRLECVQKQAELKVVQQKIKELTELQKEYESLQQQMQALQASVPTKPNVPDVVSLIGKFASQSDIIITNVTFENQQPVAAVPSSGGTEQPAAGGGVNDIDIKKCVISLKGSYASIIQFFNALRESPRLFGIERITLAQDGESGKTVKVDLSLAYFNYKAALAQPTTVQQ